MKLKQKKQQEVPSEKPKKKGKRERWPSLNVKRQVYNRKEYIDFDYIDKLSPEEKDWLNQFTKEHHIASFKKEEDKRLIKDTRAVYGENNARNRCMLSHAKSKGLLDNAPTKQYLDDIVDSELSAFNIDDEDALIRKIDIARDLEKVSNRPRNTKKRTDNTD